MENNCGIIHVAGPSASGKSSLGDRLKTIKNIIILDTDEIDDANCIKYLEKSPFSNKKEFKLLENGVKSDNKKDIDLFLNKNKEKNIIIIGHLHLGMDHIAKKITHKFCIKITEEQLFNQLNIKSDRVGPRVSATLYKNNDLLIGSDNNIWEISNKKWIKTKNIKTYTFSADNINNKFCKLPKVVKLFGLKKINYYLQKYKKIYPYNKDNYIIAEYGK